MQDCKNKASVFFTLNGLGPDRGDLSGDLGLGLGSTTEQSRTFYRTPTKDRQAELEQSL